MTVSMRRMSAGSGYKYLLKSVAAGDSDRVLSTPLTRYYADVGTPPGRWLGSGLGEFGDGQIVAGAVVTEEQLGLLVGMGRDPVTGVQLGRAYPVYEGAADPEGPDGRGRRAVAGYDLTFSVPKSVSVLWGVADADVQARIVEAHHAAVSDVLAYFEREVAATRAGFAERDGAVAQVGVVGVAAAAFDHFDSRSNDPQLHTHVVIANKVRAAMDGGWRSLDGRPVFAARTGLSAHYDALLVDRLSRDLGLEWELRQRGSDRNPRWELAGVPDELIREFSGRTRQIEAKKDELIAEYAARHGRHPSARTIVEIRARATLATRPPKEVRSLAELTTEWRTRAAGLLGQDPTPWSAGLVDQGSESLLAEAIPAAAIDELSERVVAAVSERRSTWSHWNLLAEAATQTTGRMFATTADRVAVTEAIVEAAERRSLTLTPPELAASPPTFRRPDGTSVFRQRHGERYSSRMVLDAEARLLARANDTSGVTLPSETVEQQLRRQPHLSDEQREAVRAITRSARQVDLLVGPAGAGKTTTMCALRSAWMAGSERLGRRSVVGLAPSAAAAQALSGELGVPCENTAKWLYEHGRGRAALHAGQLVIVDEATLASTTTLDCITAIAAAAGAKALLVGDPHQLQSIDAGGAFALLVGRRPDTPQLLELHRFNHEWEKNASLGLRTGDQQVIDTYQRHDRIREGHTDAMLDAAYAGWRSDRDAGLSSVMITDSASAVHALNERARADRILTDLLPGPINGREVDLRDGTRASAGDLVITRRNDRTLATPGAGWVRNGDRWRVTRVRRDGSVVVTSTESSGRCVVLPRPYVREHLDLGYAVTAHRAQGITVDTAHVVVTTTITRENLYVAMTRGRESNRAYVTVDEPDDEHSMHERETDARSVLAAVLATSGASLSAHDTIMREHETYNSVDRLAAELETIAAEAQRGRFLDLLQRSGLTHDQLDDLNESAAFGPLVAALRRAEAHHHDLDVLLPRIVAQHPLDDADDLAAVLEYRVTQTASSAPRRCHDRPRLIAGLIPEPLGPMPVEPRNAINERRGLINLRVAALASQAIADDAHWIRPMGAPPTDEGDYATWLSDVEVVAAYRDRYGVTSDDLSDGRTYSARQRLDRRRAQDAVRSAKRLATGQGRTRPPDLQRAAKFDPDFGLDPHS